MTPRVIIIYCGLLLTVSAVSIDIILPAFSAIATNLAVPYSQVQLVVPVFIFASGVGQLFWGPLSDRFGRKTILQIGLSGFVAGSSLCWLAPNLETLLAGRVVQGVCVASCAVIARSIMRDLFSGKELARNIALTMMIFALGPIIAPAVGAGLMTFTSWRVVVLLILLLGASLLALAIIWLPETSISKNKDALKFRVLKSNFLTTIQHPQSGFFLAMSGPIMGMMIFILMVVPRVYEEEFGINGVQFALLFAIHGLGIIIGQYVNRWIIGKYDIPTAIIFGAIILVLSAGLIFALSYLQWVGPYLLAACLTLFATSFLIVMSNAGALTLDPHGSIAGYVSSLFGFTNQACASIIALWSSIYAAGDITKFAIFLFAQSVFVLVMLIFWKSRAQNKG